MATIRTLIQKLRILWPHAATILASDGGANDGEGVEVTGTSAGAVNVALVALSVPTGGTIVGDGAEHSVGLTGPGVLVVASSGGTTKIGSAGTASVSGLPVIDGASYDAGGRSYADLSVVRLYVPVGATCTWGAHQ